MAREQRYRQCPVCLTVLPAGRFGVVRCRSVFLPAGENMRQCPDCGYTGLTQDFKRMGVWDAEAMADKGGRHA